MTVQWYSPGGAYVHPTLGLPESKSQMASRLVQPFLYSSRQRVAILYNGPPLFSLKIAVSHGRSGLHLIHGSLVPSHPNQYSKRHLGRFSRLCRAPGRESLYFTMGRPFLPLKLTLSMGGDMDPHLIHGSLSPPEPTTWTSQSVQTFLQGSRETDRPTDRQTDYDAVGWAVGGRAF